MVLNVVSDEDDANNDEYNDQEIVQNSGNRSIAAPTAEGSFDIGKRVNNYIY